ncbi:hypothetical protein [Bacillus weihaiensis]|nr:hypothetical protein [Bacillus weihaiensis]
MEESSIAFLILLGNWSDERLKEGSFALKQGNPVQIQGVNLFHGCL